MPDIFSVLVCRRCACAQIARSNPESASLCRSQICVSMSKSFACLISELRLAIQQSEGRRRPSEVRGEHAWTDCLKDWSQNLPTWHFVFTLTQRVRNGCCKCLWVSSVICHLLELSNLKYCCHSTKDQLHLFSGCYMLSKYTPPNSNI